MQELFAVNPCQHPIVILKDFHIADLKTVVEFIYQGEVNVAQERLPNVLKVGGVNFVSIFQYDCKSLVIKYLQDTTVPIPN